tara:strand:- start:4997 stop:5362 length:366 start_codon:yes stop_codon:yes gene_type:complete
MKMVKDNIIDTDNKKKEKIKEFSDLLDSLEATADKKKLLWKESYQNAVDDRETAGLLLTDLVLQTHGNSTNHLQFGTLMTKYLERMSKSNDQILKLAELISKEQENVNTISDDDIYNKISD